MRTVTQYGRRHDCCGLWSWGNKPLVCAETHEARKQAHSAFDQLWRGGWLPRGEAYRALAWATGWPESECHMMHMPKDKAREIPAAVTKIWAALKGR